MRPLTAIGYPRSGFRDRDHGRGGHTVFKFSPEGEVLVTHGKPGIQDFLEFLEMKERFGTGA
jgi:hypothetical protein